MMGIKIRQLTKADSEAYQKIAYGDHLQKFLPSMAVKSIREAENMLLETSRQLQFYGVFSENDLVGVIKAIYISHHEVDLLYFIGERYLRKGYAKKALYLFSTHLFSNHVSRINFSIRKDNVASVSLVKSIGAIKTGEGNRFYYYAKFPN